MSPQNLSLLRGTTRSGSLRSCDIDWCETKQNCRWHVMLGVYKIAFFKDMLRIATAASNMGAKPQM